MGNQSHPVKQTSSRNRVLRGEGRPTLRSVDREFIGRVIEPRKNLSAEADGVLCLEGNTQGPYRSGSRVPPGSNEQGMWTWGFPRNLGDPGVSIDAAWLGKPRTKEPWPRAVCRRPREIRTMGTWVVPPDEGNEVRREGHREVGAVRSSKEGGEPNRRDPLSEGAAGSRNCRRERRWEPQIPQASRRNNDG